MGRPLVLSNGQLFVGLDEFGLVHDFYYPYVGEENLTNARFCQHKIGVWVDGFFSWVDDGKWSIAMDYEDDTQIGNVKYHNESLAIEIESLNYVDQDSNSFIRDFKIKNLAPKTRDIRLFLHQLFQISRGGRADTALFVPDGNYILDYKGRYSLAISGKFADGQSFDQYAVGNFGIENKQGTFKDAEDGELSMNSVEHGGVDSVIRFQRNIDANDEVNLQYWIIASSSQSDDQVIQDKFMVANFKDKLVLNKQYWSNWIHEGNISLSANQKDIIKSSLIIKAHIDDRGAILASGDSSIFNYGRDYYAYCWPRDAAYALWPLIRLGHYGEAKAFFEFARDTMHQDGYLMHKYQPDRSVGSTWHPLVHGRNRELAIQEDETASVVYMICEYYKLSKDYTFTEHIYHSFVQSACSFMLNFEDEETKLPHASYDLWEEKFLTSTYTVCTVIGALDAASNLAQLLEYPDDAALYAKKASQFRDRLDLLYSKENYFVKGFLLNKDTNQLEFDDTVDISSLYGIFMYSGLDIEDYRIKATAEKIETTILNQSPSGGVVRYNHDNYFLKKQNYLGNPWIVSSLWLAQYYIASNQTDKAQSLIQWSLDRCLPTGVLSEQFDPDDASPIGVSPLVWSQAELINTLLDLQKLL